MELTVEGKDYILVDKEEYKKLQMDKELIDKLQQKIKKLEEDSNNDEVNNLQVKIDDLEKKLAEQNDNSNEDGNLVEEIHELKRKLFEQDKALKQYKTLKEENENIRIRLKNYEEKFKNLDKSSSPNVSIELEEELKKIKADLEKSKEENTNLIQKIEVLSGNVEQGSDAELVIQLKEYITECETEIDRLNKLNEEKDLEIKNKAVPLSDEEKDQEIKKLLTKIDELENLVGEKTEIQEEIKLEEKEEEKTEDENNDSKELKTDDMIALLDLFDKY